MANSILQATTGAIKYPMIDNYVYLYHVKNTDGKMGVMIAVPEYADSITDTINVQFAQTNALSRTAPIYSYSYSGPRSMQVAFQLHRDMMQELNYKVSNAQIEMGDDYVDTFIKYIQAAALPSYVASSKLVNPPMVAVRLGSDIFIKGVVTGGVGVTYSYPIIPGINSDGTMDSTKKRYANVAVSFTVSEVDPYDAETVMSTGSFRGLSTTLENRIYTLAGSSS